MSALMKKFLSEWLRWSDSKVNNEPYKGYHFSATVGLCTNAEEYEEHVLDGEDGEQSLYVELQEMFVADGIDGAYPFGELDYDSRACQGSMWACRSRRKWVASKLEGICND